MTESLCFLSGLTLICGISFWDDVSSLPNRIRISVHFISITLVFYGLGLFSLLPWWLIITAYIFFVGIMNAYNFMDGINGITGLYSLSILIALQYVNYKVVPFTAPDFIYFPILACMVFLFFNFRKRAKCFAGDVGSMGISFWMVTLLLQLILASRSIIWILFLAVYGVDTVCTILHRIYLKQNIFEAHRLHFYQILSNEKGISHLKVSTLYAFSQLSICMTVIYIHASNRRLDIVLGIIIIAALLVLYSFKFLKHRNHCAG
jgi:UDP-N-acetylmuramyl pentapeptide phosphotransferase/UDP-N-acetylglucosamine-1-phosphate transferase